MAETNESILVNLRFVTSGARAAIDGLSNVSRAVGRAFPKKIEPPEFPISSVSRYLDKSYGKIPQAQYMDNVKNRLMESHKALVGVEESINSSKKRLSKLSGTYAKSSSSVKKTTKALQRVNEQLIRQRELVEQARMRMEGATDRTDKYSIALRRLHKERESLEAKRRYEGGLSDATKKKPEHIASLKRIRKQLADNAAEELRIVKLQDKAGTKKGSKKSLEEAYEGATKKKNDMLRSKLALENSLAAEEMGRKKNKDSIRAEEKQLRTLYQTRMREGRNVIAQTSLLDVSKSAQSGFFDVLAMDRKKFAGIETGDYYEKETKRLVGLGVNLHDVQLPVKGFAGSFGRLAARIRTATAGLHGFKMELLSTMFFGMGMQRMAMGFMQPAMQATGAFEIWGSTMQILFLPVALRVTDVMLTMFSWFDNLSEGTKTFIRVITVLIAVLGTLLMVIGAIGLGLGGMLGSIGKVGNAFNKAIERFKLFAFKDPEKEAVPIRKAFKGIARSSKDTFKNIGKGVVDAGKSLKKFAAEIKKAGAMRLAFAGLMAAITAIQAVFASFSLPFLLLMGLIVVLAYVWSSNFLGIQETLGSLFSSVWNIFTGIYDIIAGTVGFVVNLLQGDIPGAVASMKQAIGGIGQVLYSIFIGIGGGLLKLVGTIILGIPFAFAKLGITIVGVILSILADVFNWIADKIMNFGSGLSKSDNGLVKWFGEVLVLVGQAIKGIVTFITDKVKGLKEILQGIPIIGRLFSENEADNVDKVSKAVNDNSVAIDMNTGKVIENITAHKTYFSTLADGINTGTVYGNVYNGLQSPMAGFASATTFAKAGVSEMSTELDSGKTKALEFGEAIYTAASRGVEGMSMLQQAGGWAALAPGTFVGPGGALSDAGNWRDAYRELYGVNSPVTAFARGGIVTSPTLAMIGESGAEAVIPLSKYSKQDGTGNQTMSFTFSPTINITKEIRTEVDMKKILAETNEDAARLIESRLRRI